MMEYDLLQFMENDDASTRAQFAAATAEQFQFLNVDDLLGNATGVLDSLDSITPTVGVATDALANKQTHAASEEFDAADLSAEASSLLDDLLINGDDLLAHLEAEAAAHADANTDASVSVASPCPSSCRTDPDGCASPCPSTCSETNGGGTYNTPPPGSFYDVDALMMKHHDAMTNISPTGTPVSSAPTPVTLSGPHHLLVTRSPSHGGSTEGEEASSEDDEGDKQEKQVRTEVDEAMEMEEDDVQHQSELLSKEAKYLEAQYDFLVSRAQSTQAARQSVKAKRRLREDQQHIHKKINDNGPLTQLVAQQQVYMDNFKAMLAFAPVNDIRMALMTPIESYIHLGRDFDERRRTIVALREEKLNMTYKYIEEKARGIDPTQPHQYSDVFERFGKYYSVHFAVSKYEGVEVGQVVKVVYDQMAGNDESIAAAMGCLTIREAYDSIKCNFLHQRIVSSLKWSEEFEDGLPEMESNALFFCRFVGDTAVFATDYIDRDDLHPYQSKERIRKDVSSGVVLSSHVDADGKRSVIMKKFLMAKFHMYPHNLSEKLTKILFNKMPSVSNQVTKMIDEQLHASRENPLPFACNAESAAQAQASHPQVPPQQC